jgi:hypothetical protein
MGLQVSPKPQDRRRRGTQLRPARSGVSTAQRRGQGVGRGGDSQAPAWATYRKWKREHSTFDWRKRP